nr:alpha/beta hydrolases superfamily protein [Tanacetum cinerariifolium]
MMLICSWNHIVYKSTKRKVGQIHHKREIIQNKYKENLVGILHETGSKEVVIMCHGYRSCKDKIPMVNRNLAVAFTNKGISAIRFDFAGNGDSGGSFQYRNNYRAVDDLRSVIQCFEQEKWFVTAIIGYNKGGNVVLFYALRFKDVNNVVNISRRFDLKEAQSRTYEISTPSSGSKDLVLLTYNIMPFDLPSLSLLLLYLVLFSLERSKTRRSGKLEAHLHLGDLFLKRWESDGLDSNIFTKAWVDSARSEGLKDHSAIDGSLKWLLLILTSLIGHGADKAMAVFEFLDFKRRYKISIGVKYQEAILGCQENGHHLEVLILLAYSFKGFCCMQKYAEVDACLSIVIPRSKIPSWFKEQQHGQTITLKLPPKWQNQIIGLAISDVFNPRRLYNEPGMELRFVNDEMHIPKPQIDASSIFEKENVWIGYVPLSLLEMMHDDGEDFQTKDWSYVIKGNLVIKISNRKEPAIRCGVLVVFKEEVESTQQTKPSCYQNWKLSQIYHNTF